MKYLVAALALLAAISVASCYVYSRDRGTSIYSGSKYLAYIKERQQLEQLRLQFENLCPNHSDELDDAIIKIKECTDEIDNAETACSAIRNHFLRCSKPMIQLLEKCLPEVSSEVPAFVFESINSGINYLCKTDGEHIFELMNSCLYKTNYRSIRCERRVVTKLQHYRNKPPSKSDLCELANSMKPCFQNHLQDSCGNQITREAFTGIFDALFLPCQTVTVNKNQIDTNTINEVELL